MNKKLQYVAYVLGCSLSLATVSVHADNPQQSKMKTCNADATAKTLSGADRKAYMKTCLSATPATAPTAPTPPAISAPAATPVPAVK